MASRSRLLKDIEALTSFSSSGGAEQSSEAFDDGTMATDALERRGQWIEEGEDKQGAKAPPARSKLRLAAGMDFEEDKRYRGQRVGRQALAALRGDTDSEEEEEGDESGEEDEEEDDEEDDEEEGVMAGEGEEDEEEDGEEEDEGGDYEEEEEEEEEEEDDDEEEDGSEEGDEDEESSGEEEDDEQQHMGRVNGHGALRSRLPEEDEAEEEEEGEGPSLQLLAQRSAGERRARAERAQQQREAWNNLLELRILLQPIFGLANRLPRQQALEQHRTSSEEVASSLSGIKAGLRDTLASLLTLRSVQPPLSSEAGKGGSFTAGKKRRLEQLEGPRGLEEAWQEAEEEYETSRDQWRAVVDRTHQRASLSSAGGLSSSRKKFKAVNQGLWQQVEASMADVERRQRRCHLLVGQAQVVGQAEQAAAAAEGSGEVDLEAYEDSELYQHLLKEFMDNTGGGEGAAWGVVGGGRGVGVRKSKTKKAVDTKASKGRKLRFTVHPKLEHFMFPVPLPASLPMDLDRLFASLPGSSSGSQALMAKKD